MMKSSQLLSLFILLNLCLHVTIAKDSYTKATASKDDKSEKLRICIVENRGSFRRTEQYCPLIERQANIECIVGVDRLDCARRIQKGYAHFGVFSSEDLVGARWATFEILVTNEIRFHAEEFEYEVVVVVDNEANINSAADLKKSRLCHPGKGLEGNWNDIIADYLESVMVPRQCETDLTLAESRIKATANFFGPSCKAGPWLSDPIQDQILKQRYPSLCSLCYDPARCSIGDKHWGRRGPLDCLTGASGQAAYVRLDDVRSFFGFTGLTPEVDPSGYSFLCPDGHLQPLNVNNPCTWIAKPWPVIAARRSHAERIQEMFRAIDINKEWQQALLMLLESYHVNVTSLDLPMPIDDYLDKSSGYQSAHSFPACYPPRHIVYCTTSIIEFVKCSWLQEVSTVYGIEPNLQCIRGESLYRCLDDVEKGVADVVRVDEDVRVKSEREFNLTSLLFEFSSELENNHVTVAVVKKNSYIQSFMDIKGKAACFPSYEGASFYSAMNSLQEIKLIHNNCSHTMENFFSDLSCYGQKTCQREYWGEEGALKCLKDFGDVAFISLETFRKLNDTAENLRVICPGKYEIKKYKRSSDICYLSWTSKGTLLVNKGKPQLRRNEIISSLKSMDHYFGKYRYRSGNIPFTLFGPFDQKTDVLFKDSTDGFKTEHEIVNYAKFDRNIEPFYARMLSEDPQHCTSASSTLLINLAFIVMTTVTQKPAPTKTASSVLKNEKKKATTTTRNLNAADKKSVAKKSDKPATTSLSKTNVMNTVHNVTVASPPTSAGKARSTSLINVREFENESERASNHTRSRTRTIAPEESVLLQRKLLSASVDVPVKHDPVAYEINFDDKKRTKKTPAVVVKQKSLTRQKSMVKEPVKKQSSSVDSGGKPTKQAQVSVTKVARKPLERQKTFAESEAPPAPPSPPPPPPPQEENEEEENYESDFESYESDFEAEPSEEPSCSSEESDNIVEQQAQPEIKVEKERIDSGSFDMSIKKSATPSSAQYDSIDADTINSHDSGISYEDLSALNRRLLSPKVLDFYKRGEELMRKITFDEMTFDLFEQKPIPYEVFMSVYGQRGMAQASTQSDSNAVGEEVQTEAIARASAWTQFPAKFTRAGLELISSRQYNEEKLGVGVEAFDFNDEREELDMSISAINNFSSDLQFTIPSAASYDTADLNRFIQIASITISNIIEGKSSGSRELTPSKIPLSRGHFPINYKEIEALRNTIVTRVYTNLCLSNFLVTLHKSNAHQSLMCLWNVLQVSRPLRVFCAWSNITCLEMNPQQHDFIVGGCDDGTVCLWDTQETGEEIVYPCEVISLSHMPNDFALDNVIALKSIPQRQFKSTASMFSHSQVPQIASLHENGVMSVWSMLAIENVDHERRGDMNFTHAGSKVKLVRNLSVDLTKFTKGGDESGKRRKSAFEKTRYYFENDLFSDKVLRELQEIDSERLQRSQKLAFRDDAFAAVSFDVNFNELFVASDANFIVALSRLCLGDKARKIVTSESACVSACVIKVHPANGSILAIGQSDGSVKFVKTSDEESGASASKHRKQLKRSYATSSSEENVLAKSCAFQNIVEREKKLYEETQALNNLECGELKTFLVNEEQLVIESEKVKVAFDKNIFNSFDVCTGRVRAIEFSKGGELMFVLISKSLKIFNCWANAEIECHDNQKYADVKCIHGSDGADYLILLTAQHEILVNKLKF